jgi:hypothetical protein
LTCSRLLRDVTNNDVINASKPIASTSQPKGVIFERPEASVSHLGEPTTAAIAAMNATMGGA